MVIRVAVIQQRLQELAVILNELGKYKHYETATLEANLSQRWIIERGLIAAATLIFDIADHILAGHFTYYSTSYEDSLTELQKRGVISETLYDRLKGLGGFRNILIHAYLQINPAEVFRHYHKALTVFPQFMQEISDWLRTVSP